MGGGIKYISWGTLASIHYSSRNPFLFSLLLGGLENLKISVNSIQYIHKLSLIFMNPFDMDIK